MKEWVGLDIDSVLGMTELAMYDYIEKCFNIKVDPMKIDRYELEYFPGFNEITGKQLHDAIEDGVLVDSIQPYPWAADATNRLKVCGFNICLITSRPFPLTTGTVDWLIRHNIQFDELIHAKSADKCFAVHDLFLTAFVDDRFDILTQINECCGRLKYGTYVVTHPWNRKYNDDKIDRVETVMDAVNKIIRRRNDYGTGEM